MSVRGTFLACLIAAMSAGSAGAAELIVNGGFESGTFTHDPPYPTYETISGSNSDLTGWTAGAGTSFVWGFNTTDINSYAGSGFVDLTGVGNTVPHGILNQTISTVAGQQYTFSVYTTLDPNASTVGITVTADLSAITLAGTYGTWVGYSPSGAIWRQLTGNFTAADSSTIISIAGQAGSSFMIGLDNVSVTGPDAVTVPEASTWALMIAGFAGLGFAMHRRRVSA